MIKVGKIYKLESRGFERVELTDPSTLNETSVKIENFLFLILEVDVKNENLCKKYPDAKRIKILFDGKIYYLAIHKDYLNPKIEKIYFLKFVQTK